MKCNYSVYLDGERKPYIVSKGEISSVVSEYVQPSQRLDIERRLNEGEKITHHNRRKGLKIVLTHTVKTATVKRNSNSGFLKVELEGVKTLPQIQMAAADALKSAGGWHRTVVLVKANGLVYKVKCKHKGLTYTECVHRCEIVDKKAA